MIGDETQMLMRVAACREKARRRRDADGQAGEEVVVVVEGGRGEGRGV